MSLSPARLRDATAKPQQHLTVHPSISILVAQKVNMPQHSNKADEPQPPPTQSEHQAAPTSVQSTEPATGDSQPAADSPMDSKDTTGTEDSRQKDALELNVEGKQGQRRPETPAGQHATGSFTDEASKRPPKSSA